MIKTGALRHGAKHRAKRVEAASRVVFCADQWTTEQLAAAHDAMQQPMPIIRFPTPTSGQEIRARMAELGKVIDALRNMPQAGVPQETLTAMMTRAQDAADLAETGASQDQCDRVLTGELGVARIDARHT